MQNLFSYITKKDEKLKSIPFFKTQNKEWNVKIYKISFFFLIYLEEIGTY